MGINTWPLDERPRERIVQKGAQSLSDAELLAIFLRTGTRNHSAIDVGRAMIQKYGRLGGVFSANIKDLQKIPGIGLSKAVTIKAMAELAARFLKNKSSKKTTMNTNELIRLAKIEMSSCVEETLAVMFLDMKNQLIGVEKIAEGSINNIEVNTRKITEKCIHQQANQIVLIHNHPAGDPTPSHQDIVMTEKIRQIMRPIQIYVIDHIVTTKERAISLVKEKYVEPMNSKL